MRAVRDPGTGRLRSQCRLRCPDGGVLRPHLPNNYRRSWSASGSGLIREQLRDPVRDHGCGSCRHGTPVPADLLRHVRRDGRPPRPVVRCHAHDTRGVDRSSDGLAIVAGLLGPQPGAARLLRRRRARCRDRDLAAGALDRPEPCLRGPGRGARLSRAGSGHDRWRRARPVPRGHSTNPGRGRAVGVAAGVLHRPARPPSGARRSRPGHAADRPHRSRGCRRLPRRRATGRHHHSPWAAAEARRSSPGAGRRREAAPSGQAAGAGGAAGRTGGLARRRPCWACTQRRATNGRPVGLAPSGAVGTTHRRAGTGPQADGRVGSCERCRPGRLPAATDDDRR